MGGSCCKVQTEDSSDFSRGLQPGASFKATNTAGSLTPAQLQKSPKRSTQVRESAEPDRVQPQGQTKGALAVKDSCEGPKKLGNSAPGTEDPQRRLPVQAKREAEPAPVLPAPEELSFEAASASGNNPSSAVLSEFKEEALTDSVDTTADACMLLVNEADHEATSHGEIDETTQRNPHERMNSEMVCDTPVVSEAHEGKAKYEPRIIDLEEEGTALNQVISRVAHNELGEEKPRAHSMGELPPSSNVNIRMIDYEIQTRDQIGTDIGDVDIEIQSIQTSPAKQPQQEGYGVEGTVGNAKEYMKEGDLCKSIEPNLIYIEEKANITSNNSGEEIQTKTPIPDSEHNRNSTSTLHVSEDVLAQDATLNAESETNSMSEERNHSREDVDSNKSLDGKYLPGPHNITKMASEPSIQREIKPFIRTISGNTLPTRRAAISDQPSRDNYLFYAGSIRSRPNDMHIDDMHSKWWKDYTALEASQNYLSWLFPVFEDNGGNQDASALERQEAEEMAQDVVICERFIKSYEMMLGFFGFSLVNKKDGSIKRSTQWKERFETFAKNRHNGLVISRILTSMGHLGFGKYKKPFMDTMYKVIFVDKHLVKCRGHYDRFWLEAAQKENMPDAVVFK